MSTSLDLSNLTYNARLSPPKSGRASHTLHLSQNSASRYSISSVTGPHDNLCAPDDDDDDAILDVELADIPCLKGHSSSDPCGAVLSYFSKSHSNWKMVALIQKRNESNECHVVRYDERRDQWRGLKKRESKRKEREDSPEPEYTVYFPTNPEDVVIDSDHQKLYLLDQNFVFDLVRREWSYQPLLPPIWKTSGSVTQYISFPLHEFHGLYHHDKDYGLRHLMIDEKGKVISSHIDPKRRFRCLTLLYCEWFQRLMVFGGQSIERKEEPTSKSTKSLKSRKSKRRSAKNGKLKKRRSVYRPSIIDLEKWPENTAIYYCDIGHHRLVDYSRMRHTSFRSKSQRQSVKVKRFKRADSEPVSKSSIHSSASSCPLPETITESKSTSNSRRSPRRYKWKRSKQSVGSLPHSKIRALVVFDHIAIIFLFYGKEEFIGVYCWDLITKKKYKFSVNICAVHCEWIPITHSLSLSLSL